MRNTVDDQETAEQRVVHRATWSPAQIVAMVIGLAYVVFGGVALARTGFHVAPYTYHDVAGFTHTTVLAIIEIVFGVIVLGAGAVPGADRGGMIFGGVIAIAGGLIVAIQPSSFHRVLGVNAENGWLYVITGAVLVIAAMLAPSFSSSRRDAYVGRRTGA